MTEDILSRLTAALADCYRMERELGSGGMATVYLAYDLKHDRKVAVKVLRPELAAMLGAERFLTEIKVTANLRHPHILPLYDSGEADSFLYYVMPYVEGESLREKLKREKQLSVDEAIKIAAEVADALGFAHTHKVIHRDIKPENILLEAGHAVVADFGIALAVKEAGGERLTETGLSLGTPAYMSPEQVAGEREIDGRSDVYSLACVLYEMLAGEPPFTGPTVDSIIHQHLTAAAPDITLIRPAAPEPVAVTLKRALAKTPADRFRSAALFAEACRSGPSAEPGGRSWFRALRRHGLVVAIGAAVVVIALVILRPSTPVSPGEDLATPTKAVAVLPLVNVGGESSEEYFADGLTDELIDALARNPSMRVASRTSSYAFKGTQGISSRDIGRQLEVDAIVEGAVRRSGNRVRLMVELTDVLDGLVLWSRSYERELGDVFAIQQEIASGIAEALDIQLFGSSVTVREAGTEDAEAHDLYLRGHFLYNKFTERDLRRALELYGEAVRRDSGFALAHVGIAEVWEYLADDFVAPDSAYPKARVAAQAALSIDSTLPAAHALLGGVATYYDWDLRTAEAELRRALALNPGLAVAHGSLADVLIATGRPDQAREEVRTAQRLDPLSLRQTLFSSETALRAGWISEALQYARRALELDPNSAFVWDRLGDAHLAVGMADSALVAYLRGAAIEPRNQHILVGMVRALAEQRRVDEARETLSVLEQEATMRYVRGELVADACLALGDHDRALEWLERAVAARSAGIRFLFTDRLYAPLRSDPRFQRLLETVGLMRSGT